MLKSENRKLKCIDLVHPNYRDRWDDLIIAEMYLNEDQKEINTFCSINDKYKSKYFKTIKDLELNHYADFMDFVDQYGLCFDYVEAGTFEDQKEGYFRWQLSWGGPSDEFRIFYNPRDGLYKIEYYYMDWYDGASLIIQSKRLKDIIWNCFNFHFLEI